MPTDDTWPADDLDDALITDLDGRLYRQLANVVTELPHQAHDESQPDLFGQAFKQLFDGTFQALLDGDTDLARYLFSPLFKVAREAAVRLGTDLAHETPRNQLIYGTEPLVDLMEISGYALFMQELEHAGIWPEVTALWDALLTDGRARPVALSLIDILDQRSRVFALAQGAMERMRRHIELNELLKKRGVQGRRHFYSPTPEPEVPPDQSPVVTVFVPDAFGMPLGDLEDLFVVEYLARHPDVGEIELPNKAERLLDSIERERGRQSGAHDTSDDEGAPA